MVDALIDCADSFEYERKNDQRFRIALGDEPQSELSRERCKDETIEVGAKPAKDFPVNNLTDCISPSAAIDRAQAEDGRMFQSHRDIA